MRGFDRDFDIVTEQRNGYVLSRRAETAVDTILEAVHSPGETLKSSNKSVTKRVGDLVVKGSFGNALPGLLKRSFRRARYRRGWWAGMHLERHGIDVPKVYALVETGRWGLLSGSYLVMEFLQGMTNVERFAAQLVQNEADDEHVNSFLHELAHAVTSLQEAEAYHKDLSGKNILTQDGRRFCFIDLESVVPAARQTRRMVLKNHIQLYDSFCDFWGDDFLEPFLAQMLPEGEDYARWARIVRRGQAARRSRQIALWKRQGRSL